MIKSPDTTVIWISDSFSYSAIPLTLTHNKRKTPSFIEVWQVGIDDFFISNGVAGTKIQVISSLENALQVTFNSPTEGNFYIKAFFF